MQYSRVYQQVLSRLQDETFGVTGSELVSPGAFRMMCYCIVPCDNLGRAIERASEFYRTFFDEQSQLYVNFTQEHARVGYKSVSSPPGTQVQAADGYALSMWQRFFSWLCGRPIQLSRVDFAGDPPERPEKYEALFGCPLYFRQPSNLMYFSSEYLACPVVHTEQSLNEFLRTAPYQLLIMDNESRADNLVAQVRAMIGHDFSQGFPAFDTIAQALNMSAPTLRRRLKREGVTFQQLKDESRCDAARLHLDRLEVSINQVALEMGFTDPSAFPRSFKKWTGMTPGQYRVSRRETSPNRR